MKPRRSCLIGALLVSLPFSALVAQDRPIFSSESDLVVIHATIKDRDGAYVTGLTRDAFAILEDGRPQNTQLFTSEDAPVTVGLLIDSSASMQRNRARVIAAAAAFAEVSHPSDEMFALALNDSVRAALPPTVPFTSDVGILQDGLTNTIRRQIRLIVQSPENRRLTVRSRSGYLAGLPKPRRADDGR